MAWQKDVVTVLTMKKSILDGGPKSYEEWLVKKFGFFLRVPPSLPN